MKRLAVVFLAVVGAVTILDYAAYLALKTKDEKFRDARKHGR